MHLKCQYLWHLFFIISEIGETALCQLQRGDLSTCTSLLTCLKTAEVFEEEMRDLTPQMGWLKMLAVYQEEQVQVVVRCNISIVEDCAKLASCTLISKMTSVVCRVCAKFVLRH